MLNLRILIGAAVLVASAASAQVGVVQGQGTPGHPRGGVLTVQTADGGPVEVTCPDGTCSGGGGSSGVQGLDGGFPINVQDSDGSTIAKDSTLTTLSGKVLDDVGLSTAASESLATRLAMTSALRLWDQTAGAGSQLVGWRGDTTNGGWVNVKLSVLPTGASTAARQDTLSAQLPAALDGSGFFKAHEQGTANVSIQNASLPVTESGTWNITNISGTVSLPTGAATGTKQDTGNASLGSIDGKLADDAVAASASADERLLTRLLVSGVLRLYDSAQSAGSKLVPWAGTLAGGALVDVSDRSGRLLGNITNISGTITLPSNAAKETGGNLDMLVARTPALGAAVTANSSPVNIASDDVVAVSATSLPLPTGAATAARQDTGNTSLANISSALTDDAATSAAASEALATRLSITSALRGLDTSQAGGSQLVPLKATANSLWSTVTDGLGHYMPPGDSSARSIHETLDNATISTVDTLSVDNIGLAKDASLMGGKARVEVVDQYGNIAPAGDSPFRALWAQLKPGGIYNSSAIGQAGVQQAPSTFEYLAAQDATTPSTGRPLQTEAGTSNLKTSVWSGANEATVSGGGLTTQPLGGAISTTSWSNITAVGSTAAFTALNGQSAWYCAVVSNFVQTFQPPTAATVAFTMADATNGAVPATMINAISGALAPAGVVTMPGGGGNNASATQYFWVPASTKLTATLTSPIFNAGSTASISCTPWFGGAAPTPLSFAAVASGAPSSTNPALVTTQRDPLTVAATQAPGAPWKMQLANKMGTPIDPTQVRALQAGLDYVTANALDTSGLPVVLNTTSTRAFVVLAGQQGVSVTFSNLVAGVGSGNAYFNGLVTAEYNTDCSATYTSTGYFLTLPIATPIQPSPTTYSLILPPGARCASVRPTVVNGGSITAQLTATSANAGALAVASSTTAGGLPPPFVQAVQGVVGGTALNVQPPPTLVVYGAINPFLPRCNAVRTMQCQP